MVAAVVGYLQRVSAPNEVGGPAAATEPTEEQSNLRKYFEQKRSGVWVEATAKVSRLLSDDLEGDRHQRLIVRMPDGHTVLIAHNIDLAKRVPVSRGESIRFRGRFEYNEQGGVVHWTHKHPRGTGPAGWISYRDHKYW